jgi:hypothetical protein
MCGACSTHWREEKYKMLVKKPEGKRPLGRLVRRCEDDIRLDLKEIGWEDVDWIHNAGLLRTR